MSSTRAPGRPLAGVGSSSPPMPLPKDSQKPYPQALRALLADRDLTYRRLAALTQSADGQRKGLSHAYLNQLARGEAKPTDHTLAHQLELVARASGVDPRYFREYREHLAAQEARQVAARVGLDEVLAALRDLER